MLFRSGNKFKIRRSPSSPLVNAVIDHVVAEIDDKAWLAVWLTVTIDDPNDTSSRPNEQLQVGAFHFSKWVEWGKE